MLAEASDSESSVNVAILIGWVPRRYGPDLFRRVLQVWIRECTGYANGKPSDFLSELDGNQRVQRRAARQNPKMTARITSSGSVSSRRKSCELLLTKSQVGSESCSSSKAGPNDGRDAQYTVEELMSQITDLEMGQQTAQSGSRSQTTADVMVRGRWRTFPALEVQDRLIAITGKWLRRAILHGEARQVSPLRDPVAAVEVLRKQRGRLRADVFTFAEQLPQTAVQYAYLVTWESVALIWIKDFDTWWNALPSSTRKNIRRAEKGGVIVTTPAFDDDLLRGIASINDASPVRQGRANYHYGKKLDQLRKELGSYPDRSTFICASVDGEMIAFLKVVYQGESASILNLAVKPAPSSDTSVDSPDAKSDNRYRGVARVLIAKAVELCAARQVRCLKYGLFNYGNKQSSSLREFKTLNGFIEVQLPRYYVPLTRWGALCLRLNLHRGLIGILPSPVIARAVALRARLYTLKETLRQSRGVRPTNSAGTLT
jgi:hypothetical protein